MVNAMCERRNTADTPEGKRLMEINNKWKDTLKKLCEIGVFGPKKLDELEIANFGAALISWEMPAHPRLWNRTIVKGYGIKQRTGIPIVKKEKVVYACSTISSENRKMSIKNKASQEFYDNMIVLNKVKEEDFKEEEGKKKYAYNHINVDDYRSIGFGHERHNDVEAKILEEITDFVKENKITKFTVHLFTQLEPCLSCDYVIIKFTEEFPNAITNLYYEEPYNKLIIP